jgi:hypothetical protein
MSQHRKHRGYATQRMVADYLAAAGWIHAEPVGAGRPGSDITGVPFDVEVKARRDLDLTGTLRQLADRTDGRFPFAVIRPDGYGPARIDEWPAVVRLADLVALLRELDAPEVTP